VTPSFFCACCCACCTTFSSTDPHPNKIEITLGVVLTHAYFIVVSVIFDHHDHHSSSFEFNRYSILIHCYLEHCGPVQRALVDQQAHLWSEEGAFAGVAAAVYACKGQGKKKYVSVLRAELNKLQSRLPNEFSLPIDPRMVCCGVKVDKCRVMSSAKLPLWLVFENADPLGEDVMVMFKAGDDLRQDTMVRFECF
jgi:microsomal dipeptidase-like Zn-dependent dipeptidase